MKTNRITLALVTLLFVAMALSCPSYAFGASSTVDMYRLYNPYNGEHLYTAKQGERDDLVCNGWKYEGIGWVAPQSSKTPVYRLYNSYSGDHHYTTSSSERDSMVRNGWTYEQVGWYSDDSQSVPVYREFNPYVTIGTHNYTTSKSEHENLGKIGWKLEDIGWYAVRSGVSSTTRIMGKPQSSVEKMVALYRSTGKQYPSEVLAKGGAPNIEAFCSIVYNQAASEGVRPEVVFSQAMVETGWLQFGGDVKPEQFNFAGIGATGNGNQGISFASVKEGILAQVQHLKGYASTDALNNPCVDPRFKYLADKRGSAPYVENLGGAWAADVTYGYTIVGIMEKLE